MPSLEPRIAMYCKIAVTGQRGPPVFPIYTSTPLPSWLDFVFLRCTLSNCGSSVLSMATSPKARCLVLSKAFSGGTVISPEWKKPKKQRVAAAKIIRMSLFVH